MLRFFLLLVIVLIAAALLRIRLRRTGRPVVEDDLPLRRGPRPWGLLLIPVVLAVYVIGLRLIGLYTEWLWWNEDARQGGTFLRLLRAEWGWGAAFALLAMAFTGINIWLARQKSAGEIPGAGRILARVAGIILLALAAVNGAGFGARHWPEVLLWRNRQPFGMTEPIFGKDAGFYVFTLPLLQNVSTWLVGLLILNIAGILAVYLLRSANRLGLRPAGGPGRYQVFLKEGESSRLWNRLLSHSAVLGALLFMAFLLRSRLALWELMYSPRGVVHGPGYTDVHVYIPGWNLMALALILGAVLMLVAARAHTLRATFRAIQAGLITVVAVWILGLNLIPGLVQRYRVSPNETTLEIPYIQHNMKFTRYAFGLTDDRLERRDFPPIQPIDPVGIAADSTTLRNMRLWDWRALESTYDQNQSFRQYYDFYDVDIDRYVVDGHIRQVMLSLREMNLGAFNEQALTWVNRRLIYTHGYGACMNPTNEFTPEGLPNYWLRDIPPTAAAPAVQVNRPQVYYGELTRGHVYVQTTQKEFDYPRGDQNEYTRYDGAGGVRIGTGLRRLALAMHYDGLKQLTSADITSQSRILFRRQVMERVRTLAPFLRFDDDPYAVVDDGRLLILVDAYTVSDHFPYSERMRGGLNYIRNSVKAVVDCYDGRVTFYVFDEQDPIIRAWQSAFPGLFTPGAQMPAGLRQHVRYPEDLLTIQARVFSVYHMTDPLVFYNKEDRWAIARESLGQADADEMLPYYAVMKLPGEAKEEFVHLIPFTPFSVNQPKNNMVGWMAGRCDGNHYGKLLLYRFPKQSLVYGPMQIEARIDQDAVISKDLTLWNQQGSSVIRGNLIVVPLQNALLYTKPIFLQATHSRMPELKRVVVASQDRLGYGASFPEALASLIESPLPGELYRAITGRIPEPGNEFSFGLATGDTTALERGRGPEAAPAGRPLDAAGWQAARDHYRRYLELMGQGKVEEAGRELERLGHLLGAGGR